MNHWQEGHLKGPSLDGKMMSGKIWRKWSLWSGWNKYSAARNGKILSRKPRLYQSCSTTEEGEVIENEVGVKVQWQQEVGNFWVASVGMRRRKHRNGSVYVKAAQCWTRKYKRTARTWMWRKYAAPKRRFALRNVPEDLCLLDRRYKNLGHIFHL